MDRSEVEFAGPDAVCFSFLGNGVRSLDRPFCERSILCFAHVSFFSTHFFRRLQTDISETFPHDVALLEKEALLCRFPKSAP